MPEISGIAPANTTAAQDFTTLPEELKGLMIQKSFLLPTYMFDGLAEVQDAFETIYNDGRTALYTWEFLDIIKKAEDEFVPGKIAELKARIPGMQDYEIDTFIARSTLIDIFRGYQSWMFGLKGLDQALQAQFAVYFLQNAMQKLIVNKIATKAIWRGTRTANQADRGAEKAFKGMIETLEQGAATGGDIPAANIYSGDPLTPTNAYTEINNIAQLGYNNEMMLGVPMNIYLSPENYSNYNLARRLASPNTVKLGDMVTSPDYMPTLTFKPQVGLAGSGKVLISPKSNLKLSVNSDASHYNSEMIKVMKGWELNILASGGVDYGYGKAIFMNDAI